MRNALCVVIIMLEIMGHDGHAMRGHCFTVYTDGIYWMTAASLPLNIKTKSNTSD